MTLLKKKDNWSQLEKLSQEVESTQKSVAETKMMITEVRIMLTEFIKSNAAARRERTWS